MTFAAVRQDLVLGLLFAHAYLHGPSPAEFASRSVYSKPDGRDSLASASNVRDRSAPAGQVVGVHAFRELERLAQRRFEILLDRLALDPVA